MRNYDDVDNVGTDDIFLGEAEKIESESVTLDYAIE